jgi:hypothetical protein
MSSLQEYVDSQLIQGRGFFTKPAALADLGLSPEALKSAIGRLSRKGDLVSPRRGFYLILRPEDRALGAPDPARWIDPLMKFLEVDYRISLLRAAAFHGAAHQAAMVFQIIAPRLGRMGTLKSRKFVACRKDTQRTATRRRCQDNSGLSKQDVDMEFRRGLELLAGTPCRV